MKQPYGLRVIFVDYLSEKDFRFRIILSINSDANIITSAKISWFVKYFKLLLLS